MIWTIQSSKQSQWIQNYLSPFFEFFTSNLKSIYDEQIIEAIQEDLWAHPWDYVINKYKIPMEIVINSITVLDNLPSDLAISTYG